MKLELKHLAPYLPYGLGICWRNIEGGVVIARMSADDYDSDTVSLQDVIDLHYNPILRPLSDLTKEIEHNGEKFVPMFVLFGCDSDDLDKFEIYGEIPEYWKTLLRVDVPNDWEYNFVKRLFEWHFDVFGLIEQGLAINMNEL